MITLAECATMCVLEHDDISVIAEFEHNPVIADALLSTYLATPNTEGPSELCRAMIRDVRGALDDGLLHHATEIVMALRQFLEENPQAALGITIH